MLKRIQLTMLAVKCLPVVLFEAFTVEAAGDFVVYWSLARSRMRATNGDG